MTETGIAIIGGGFGGLGTAIRLKQAGIDDFVVLEKAEDVGGTWRDNTYPGCACDVESHLYSFSFALNPAWSRMFSGQAEIWKYLRECTDRFGLRPYLRFGSEVRAIAWDESRLRWRIDTSRGEYEACVVVAATGAFDEPRMPAVPGLERFEGKVMHSARWDHTYDLTGKRVAVIGTGASAIQFIPEIQPRVASLVLFQRTPAWVVPSLDRPLAEGERRLLARAPFLQKLWRLRIYLTREALGAAFRHPWLLKLLERTARRHIARAIADPALRRKLTPDYRIGCKRILMSNTYYPALARENARVVTEPIREIGPRSVMTADGASYEADAIVLGTGFQVTEMPFSRRIRGRDGALLSDVWRGSPHCHVGTTVPGFPNLFLLLGPNTGLGHNSVLLMIESQIAHVLAALEYMRKRGVATVEPRPEAERRFNERLQRKMRRTVWVNGGCTSWYLNRTGRNAALWPGSVGAFRRRVSPFRPAEYRATPARGGLRQGEVQGSAMTTSLPESNR